MSGQNVIVSGDFWIAYKWLETGFAPCLGLEYSVVDGRSFYGSPGSWTVDGTYDYMISAVISSLGGGAGVGGFVGPVNKLAVLAPWLAVIGLVGCIGTIVVVAKKRR